MAPHSSTLAWNIPWMEGPGGLQSMGSVAKSQIQLSDFTFTFHFHSPGKEMATHPSILGWIVPMDRGTWWATVHRVAKSWTRREIKGGA